MISYAKAGAEPLRLRLPPCSQSPSLPFSSLRLTTPGTAVKVKPGLHWGPQVGGGGRAVGCLPGRLREREQRQPRREVGRAQQSWEDGAQRWKKEPSKASDVSHRTIGSGAGPAGLFILFLVQYFLIVPMSLHFGMVMYIPYLGMLEASDLLFDFTGGYKEEVALSLGGDFGL